MTPEAPTTTIDQPGLYQITTTWSDGSPCVMDVEAKESNNGVLYVHFGAGTTPAPVDEIRTDCTIRKMQ